MQQVYNFIRDLGLQVDIKNGKKTHYVPYSLTELFESTNFQVHWYQTLLPYLKHLLPNVAIQPNLLVAILHRIHRVLIKTHIKSPENTWDMGRQMYMNLRSKLPFEKLKYMVSRMPILSQFSGEFVYVPPQFLHVAFEQPERPCIHRVSLKMYNSNIDYKQFTIHLGMYIFNYQHLAVHMYVDILLHAMIDCRTMLSKDSIFEAIFIDLFGKNTDDINFIADSIIHNDKHGLHHEFGYKNTWKIQSKLFLKDLPQKMNQLEQRLVHPLYRAFREFATNVTNYVLKVSPVPHEFRSKIEHSTFEGTSRRMPFAKIMVLYIFLNLSHSTYHTVIPVLTETTANNDSTRTLFPAHNMALEFDMFAHLHDAKLRRMHTTLVSKVRSLHRRSPPEEKFMYNLDFYGWNTAA